MKTYRISVAFIFFAFLESPLFAQPKNIILFIGDGMGFEQVKATEYFLGTPMVFASFPNKGQVTTYSANSSVTDSAAAATAIATGTKVNNGVISMRFPGDGSELQTLLEYCKAQGKEVGLVTTTYLTHATPAAFGAHEPSRGNYTNIGDDIVYQTKPHVLLGGGANGLDAYEMSHLSIDPYNVVTDLTGFLTVVNQSNYTSYFAGLFGGGYMPYKYDYLGEPYLYPDLSEMTIAAIEALRDDPDGFFLMVEGGLIDQACHSSDLPRCIYEVIDLNEAVASAFSAYSADPDTLILVTADHETGGLTVTSNPEPGVFPVVSWSTAGGHTGANVPIYAWGKNSHLIGGTINNTDIWNICTYNDNILPPDPISNPSPLNASVNVPIQVVLSWIAGNGATSHDVYFGTDTLTYIGRQTATTYDPGTLEYNTAYQWRIDEINNGGVTAGPVLTFTTESIPPSVTVTANGETTSRGTVTGTYTLTYVSDDQYESIREVVNPPNKNGYSTLSHTWIFDIPSAVEVAVHVEAFHSPSTDNDNFIFAYSLDGYTFSNLLTVTRTNDDDLAQISQLPNGTQGRVYIRVTDTNHIKGTVALDELLIDSLYIVCSNEPSQCQPISTDYTVLTEKLAADKGFSYGLATVSVKDNCGNPVGGALVSGHFTRDFTDSFTNVPTDTQGQVVFQTSTQLRKPSFGFVVDSITHGSLSY